MIGVSRVLGSALSRRAASQPSIPGISRSIRMRSGRSAAAMAQAQERTHVLQQRASFRNENREVEEYKRVGAFGLDVAAPGHVVTHRFDEPLVSRLDERYGDCVHTLEIELAWQGAPAQRT